MHIVEVKNANYGYAHAFQLVDVSFRVIEGMLTGIIGPNGSGKSTLLKGISGELALPENQVFLKGKDLAGFTDTERAKEIAVVTQFSEPIDISVERSEEHTSELQSRPHLVCRLLLEKKKKKTKKN